MSAQPSNITDVEQCKKIKIKEEQQDKHDKPYAPPPRI